MANEMSYSLEGYFGGKDTEGYRSYKEGQSSGKWKDLPDYIAKGGSGKGSSGGALDLSKVPSATEFAKTQEAGIDTSLNNLVMKMRSQRNPLDVYNELETASGLPEQRKVAQTLRESISGIEDTIRRVEPNIAATTRESMVTEAQRQGMSTAQKKPLLERLSELSTALGRVSEGISAEMQDLSTKVGLFLQGQTQELEPLKIAYEATIDKAARLTSAFSTDSQNQLQVLLANWNRQNQLDDREYEQAFTLLQQENNYTKELQKTAASSGIAITGKESNDELLKKIGLSAAEEIQFDRNQKLKNDGGGSIIIPGYNTEGSDWEIYKDGTAKTDLSRYIIGNNG